jgi:rod shape-determining protein MreC
MSANPAQQKTHWILAALLLSQLVLMSYNARRPDSEQSMLRTWALTVFTPVVRAADSVISTVTETIASYINLRNARKQNEALHEQVETLTAETNDLREKAAEADKLRNLLAVPPKPSYQGVAANVVSRDPTLWFRRLTIDRGTLDGLKHDMPVVSGAGIVGRIIAVGPKFATVQVITDKHAGVGAMLQTSRAMGEVRGLDSGLCELKNISSSENIEVNEPVVTTGLDRIYPKGLLVGAVERIEIDPNAPWHKIVVRPAAEIDRIEHVIVLLIEPKDLKIEEGK